MPRAHVARIVVDYALQNPGELKQDAHGLLLRALADAYPCRSSAGIKRR